MKVAVIGATGAVGAEMISVLFNRKFPLTELCLMASERSANVTLDTAFGSKLVEVFSVERAREMDIVLMAVSGDFAKKFAPQIVENGPTVVIDNSSAFRYDDNIPLVVPEINPHRIGKNQIIANPNCTTAILCVALAPLHENFELKKVIVSTYQATSGAGAAAMRELETQTQNYLDGRTIENKEFAHPIPFNLIPHIDAFQDNGYTKEEMKVVWETQKILECPGLPVSCTAVRVPTFRAHAESVTIETKNRISVSAARELLQKAPGVALNDDVSIKRYPMPLTATKRYDVEVGRIRQSLIFGEYGLDLFVCGDQLLKGAALNAVQIAEHIGK